MGTECQEVKVILEEECTYLHVNVLIYDGCLVMKT
jgi:hypothetical protein